MSSSTSANDTNYAELINEMQERILPCKLDTGRSAIAESYAGKCVFITGATGFIGKVNILDAFIIFDCAVQLATS